MFKKKIPKYSIRKLTVGAASVLIGMAFLNSNEAKIQIKSLFKPRMIVKFKQSQSQLNRLKILLRIQKKTLIKLYINDYTGKAIYQLTRSTNKYEYIPEFSGEFKDGQAIGIDHTFTNKYGSYTATTRPFIYNDIAGFKLLNYDDIAKTFSQVTSNGGAIMTGDKDIELTLHYAPLSDTYIRYVDENGKPKANKVIATANNNVVLTEYFLFYQYKLYRPYDPYG